MSINIWTDSMQHAELLGKPVLFTNWLIQRDIIPDGWYCYDLRGTHKSPSTQTTLVDHAADYHAGTVLSPIPLKHEGTASRRVNGTFYLLGEELTLEQFCEEHDLAYTLWNSRGCNSISKGCDTGWNGMGTSNTRHTAVAGLDPSGRNRSCPSSQSRKGESCDGGKRPADKRQRPPNLG